MNEAKTQIGRVVIDNEIEAKWKGEKQKERAREERNEMREEGRKMKIGEMVITGLCVATPIYI